MSIFKCKMCGGTLEIKSGETVSTCEYCGTKQTLPKLDDEKKANLFDRANHFRRNNEYDKAMGIYEQILNEDTQDAESYWSIVLCRYGIEYVEDPASHKRVPTVNRAQFTSVFDDEDYKSAIKYADAYQKVIYENEATQINEIQKGILAISQNEEPFDVFICYKETDKDGRRTQDSVLATELYHELIEEGYKVFFSCITLEDKLGIAYEPYIFAALHSAKVMVVLGTKPEHFNAVWVKNEWSRYLSLIKEGASKILIPAYRDMDPYDLPEEFSHLQAQDMSKLGFMQDLVRGIKKLSLPEEEKEVKETVVMGNANADPLLRRAFMFLEDGDFVRADEFCEQVLNIEPENPKAYLGKLMAELKVRSQDDLVNCKEPFDDRNNYKKAIRFADNNFKNILEGYITSIIERNEHNRLETIYTSAKQKMEKAETENSFLLVAGEFDRIPKYKDAKVLAEECRHRAETARKDTLYMRALNVLEKDYGNLDDHKEALEIFKDLEDFKDAHQKAVLCEGKIKEIEDRLEKERIENERLQKEAEERRKKATKLTLIALAVVIVSVTSFCIISDSIRYNKAVLLYENGQYQEAIDLVPAVRKTEFYKLCYDKCREKVLNKYIIADVSNKHFVMVNEDGTVTAKSIGEDIYGVCDVSDWINITDVSVSSVSSVGVGSDGRVVYAGSNSCGQGEVSDWNDIVDVEVSSRHTVGLKSDGTVVAVGENTYGQCNVSDWTDIIEIAVGIDHTVGLKSDGTVVAVGNNSDGRCNTEKMKDIIAVCAGGHNTIGLKADGTVTISGSVQYNESAIANCEKIVSISAGYRHIVALRMDGTVVAVGNNSYKQCNVESWSDIEMILAIGNATLGFKDGGKTILSAGE